MRSGLCAYIRCAGHVRNAEACSSALEAMLWLTRVLTQGTVVWSIRIEASPFPSHRAFGRQINSACNDFPVIEFEALGFEVAESNRLVTIRAVCILE